MPRLPPDGRARGPPAAFLSLPPRRLPRGRSAPSCRGRGHPPGVRRPPTGRRRWRASASSPDLPEVEGAVIAGQDSIANAAPAARAWPALDPPLQQPQDEGTDETRNEESARRGFAAGDQRNRRGREEDHGPECRPRADTPHAGQPRSQAGQDPAGRLIESVPAPQRSKCGIAQSQLGCRLRPIWRAFGAGDPRVNGLEARSDAISGDFSRFPARLVPTPPLDVDERM